MIARLPVILADGRNWSVATRPGHYPIAGRFHPFSLMIEPDHTMRVYGEIKNESGIVIVRADGNAIWALPQHGCDINSDQRAVEIVDDAGKPVFQLMKLSRAEWDKSSNEDPHIPAEAREVLRVNYIARQDTGWQIVTPYENRECGNLQEVENLRSQMMCIFAYPGHKYPGKRVSETSATLGEQTP